MRKANSKNNKKNLPNRKSIRLKGYDYAQPGFYFITIVTKNHRNLFGKIKYGEMILNKAGKIAEKYWLEIPQHFPNTRLHEYIIMPNHIHGIIEILEKGEKGNNEMNALAEDNSEDQANNNSVRANNSLDVRANYYSPVLHPNNNNFSSSFRSPSMTIGSIIRGYKIGVTKWFRENYPEKFPIGKSIWHRNYWEHIIRNEKEYLRISRYIINNPAKWEIDKLKSGNKNKIKEPQAEYYTEKWMI